VRRRSRRQRGLSGDLLAGRGKGGNDVALVDPALDPDGADRCAGSRLAIINIGAQRVERHATLPVPLAPAHVGAPEASLGLNPYSKSTRLHGGLNGSLHSPTECHPPLQLVGDAASKELGVGLGILHLDHVQFHRMSGDLVQTGPQAVCLNTAAADHHSRTGGVDINLNLFADTLDLDSGHGTAQQLTIQVVANLRVLVDEIGVALVGMPAGFPIGGYAEAEAVWVNLLAH